MQKKIKIFGWVLELKNDSLRSSSHTKKGPGRHHKSGFSNSKNKLK